MADFPFEPAPVQMPAPAPVATVYAIRPLPWGHDLAEHFEVRLEMRQTVERGTRWEIRRRQRSCDANGDWDYGPLGDDDPDDWADRYWHDWDTAVRVGTSEAMQLTKAGWTALDWLAKEAHGG